MKNLNDKISLVKNEKDLKRKIKTYYVKGNFWWDWKGKKVIKHEIERWTEAAPIFEPFLN